MKLAPTKHFLAIAASLAALLLAGCQQTPTRPSPNQTVLGTGIGPAGNNGSDTLAGGGVTQGDLNGLTQRTDGFDQAGHNYDLLAKDVVYFEYDKSSLKPSERAKLKDAKDYLDKNPTMRLLLEGHCDWRGTAEYNLGLGDRRANETKKYLLSLGVAADKIETLSKGSLEAAKNADKPTMEKDRRVNLVVVNPAGGTSALPAMGPNTPAMGSGNAPAPAPLR